MSSNTATPAAVTVAPIAPVSTLPTVEDMRELIAALDITEGVKGDAVSALFGIVRARYASHAARFTRDVQGARVLPDTFKSDVSALMWSDATGSRKPTPVAERTPGIKTFAQYLSRFATVATDTVFGVDALADDELARASYTAILDERKDDHKRDERTRASIAHDAYLAWVDSLPTGDRAALKRAVALLTDNSVGVTHAPAFVALVTA
jgi:hypothetical protein